MCLLTRGSKYRRLSAKGGGTGGQFNKRKPHEGALYSGAWPASSSLAATMNHAQSPPDAQPGAAQAAFQLNLRHLRGLTAVHEHGSISAGRWRGGVSQPALTQGILKLGEATGEVLFERPDGIVPTAAGGSRWTGAGLPGPPGNGHPPGGRHGASNRIAGSA